MSEISGSPSKRSRRSPRKRKPTYRGGGKSNYIPVQYRKEKANAFASPSKHEKHAGAIDHIDLPYGTFLTEREFQNDISKEITKGYVSRCSKEFIMGGGDKIDTIRQEVQNLLHNKKRLEVFGSEEDRIQYLLNQKDLLYGNKSLPDGTVKMSYPKNNKIKFYEGYQTQEFTDGIQIKQEEDLNLESLKETIDQYERRKRADAAKRSTIQTTYLDMSPKKFRQTDLRL